MKLSPILVCTIFVLSVIPPASGRVLAADKDRQDVRGIGMLMATAEFAHQLDYYGRLHVKGKILAHSNSELLNKHMDNNTPFRIILNIMQNSYPEDLGMKQFTFDGCHIDDREFQLDSYGYALTTYTFTADRIRES